MPLSQDRLREIVVLLASRPGHETVRVLLSELLVHGLGASSTELLFERPVPEVHGRIDALLGRTVFEIKSDLRHETSDAVEQLSRYLGEREAATGQKYVGIAIDGVTFTTYERRNDSLRQLSSFTNSPDSPRALLEWLRAAVAIGEDLELTPETVRRELGRESLAWHVAREELSDLWMEAGDSARLKRALWARLLERVYGSSVDQDILFFQHSYLTVIAKTMATCALGITIPEPTDLLSGRPFYEAGIGGAVESDFFDWLLDSDRGSVLVRRIAKQVGRFRLQDVQTDVLKGLYESLIDPEQRHELGEYYTPDWLASRICDHAIDRPLEQKVLDPACGSGTFLFQAVRRLLNAAAQAGLSNRDSLELACQLVVGVDVHPVAVQIARVTFLLALGEQRLRDRPPHMAIPVYLGDSLQWNTRGFLAEQEVLIEVPDSEPLLQFPFEVARDPGLFDAVISRMLELSEQDAPPEALSSWLEREQPVSSPSAGTLARTYTMLRDLQREGRNHIWGFVGRNLVRPVWLSQEGQRADVLIGNPPWLSYRFMAGEAQQRFREECQRRGLWKGGRVATHQDLSAYFFARCVELYLKPGGNIAFVMPYAAMTRRQFEGFRTGVFATRRGRRIDQVFAVVHFIDAWVFAEDLRPLFPVPSCVLFARLGESGSLPSTILTASGTLPRRDSSVNEAEERLVWNQRPWPAIAGDEPISPYQEEFRNGATIFPRMLCVVELDTIDSLGPNPLAPVVQSRRTRQEKEPWKNLPDLRGNVESEFLRPLCLGESVAPFRTLTSVLAVIPWKEQEERLLDAVSAQHSGYLHLARWLDNAERLWVQHRRGSISFLDQLDYYGKLSVQFPTAPLRVLYTASGTLPAVAILRQPAAVVEHGLYWLSPSTEAEAQYLTAVLNSETARSRVAGLQARGQWGARHFDKVMFSLPIARFEPSNLLHQELAVAGTHAEEVAASVDLQRGVYFVSARRAIRQSLGEDGVTAHINSLVEQLLGTG